MRTSYREMFHEALSASLRKASKAGAWAAANQAADIAHDSLGIANAHDLLGHENYPNLDALRKAVNGVAVVIVSRHAGAVEWLRRHGIEGRVVAQTTPVDVIGAHVVGNLPMHLAALADLMTVIDLPGLTVEQRGKDLTPEEMDAAGAVLHSYTVRVVA